MARRRRQRGGEVWWAAILLVLAAVALWWWLGTRRAEAPAPPATLPGARALANPPGAASPAARAPEHISGEEREELQRILRERGGAGGAP